MRMHRLINDLRQCITAKWQSVCGLSEKPSVLGSVVEYNVANVVARVRFPDDAFLSVWVLTQSMFDANYRERKFVSFELIGFLLGSLHKSWKIQFAFPD